MPEAEQERAGHGARRQRRQRRASARALLDH